MCPASNGALESDRQQTNIPDALREELSSLGMAESILDMHEGDDPTLILAKEAWMRVA